MMDDLCVSGHIPRLALARARLENWIQVRAGTEVYSLDDGARQREIRGINKVCFEDRSQREGGEIHSKHNGRIRVLARDEQEIRAFQSKTAWNYVIILARSLIL